jgi:hypothetical protein
LEASSYGRFDACSERLQAKSHPAFDGPGWQAEFRGNLGAYYRFDGNAVTRGRLAR